MVLDINRSLDQWIVEARFMERFSGRTVPTFSSFVVRLAIFFFSQNRTGNGRIWKLLLNVLFTDSLAPVNLKNPIFC